MGQATLQGSTIAYAGWIYGTNSPAEKWTNLRRDQIAEQMLAQYLRHGRTLFPKILGEFTVCIFSGEETLCFRSLLSPEQIYYSSERASNRLARVASRLNSLQIDEDYLLRYFLQSRPLSYQSRQTPVRGIRRLLPGHCLSVIGGRPQEQEMLDSRSYASHQDPAQTPDSVGEELHALFEEIVRDRVQAAGDRGIYCELSGGLDSSYIAAVVGGMRNAVPAFMFLDPQVASHRFNEECARDVAKQCGLTLQTLPLESRLSVNLSEPLPYADEPNPFFWQGVALYKRSTFFVADDAVIFSGVGADQLFIRNPAVIPWLMKTGKMGQFFRTLEDYGKVKKRSSVNLFLQSLLCLLPARPVRFLQRRFAVLSTEDIDPEFGSTHQRISWLRSSAGRGKDSRLRRELEEEEKRERQRVFGEAAPIRADLAYCMSVYDSIGPHLERKGIRHFTPYYDQRLVDFVNSRVSWRLIHDWRVPYKNLLRQAQRGVVPEKVRTRRKNEFDFGSYLRKVYEDNRAFLRHLLTRSEVLDAPLFSRAEIPPAFEEQLFGVNSASAQRINDLVMMLLWWRDFQAEAACLT